jgi:hypothetical protein
MKTFILSLPMAQEPDFSLDDLLEEIGRAGDNDRDLRKLYDGVREMLLEIPRYESRLKQAAAEIDRAKRLI